MLWLAAAALVLLSLPLFSLFDAQNAELQRLRNAIVSEQAQRLAPPSVHDTDALYAHAAEMGSIEDDWRQLLVQSAARRTPWNAVLAVVLPTSQCHVRLYSLSQHGSTVIIRGEAESDAYRAAYAARLGASSLVGNVEMLANPAGAFEITLSLREATP